MQVTYWRFLICCWLGSLPTAVEADAGRQSFFSKLFGRRRGGSVPRTRDGFEILEEKLAYSGWRTIVQRTVRMRNGKIADFDVSAHEI